jgi:plasmid stability protein
MKNVTITLEENVARWARVRAAEMDKSLSRLVGEILKEKMREEDEYLKSKQQYLSIEARRLKGTRQKYPPREKLHER